MQVDIPQKGDSDQVSRAASTAQTGRVAVGQSEALEEGSRLVVDLNEKLTVGIFRLDGELYAYENTCAHSGGPVCQGRILPRVVEVMDKSFAIHGQDWDKGDMHIVCPWHGFEYSIKTGQHAGDSRIHLRSFPVSEAEGVIYVDL